DEAAAGGGERDARLAAAAGAHVGHLALSLGDLFNHGAGKLFVDVGHHGFIRLLAALRPLAEQHPGAADRQFEAFAAHRLDQDAQLTLAPARHFESVLLPAFGDTDGDVALCLPLQPVADHPALHLVALTPGVRA